MRTPNSLSVSEHHPSKAQRSGLILLAMGLGLALILSLSLTGHVLAAPAVAGLAQPPHDNVSGNIVTHTTWTLANSPYTLTGDVIVDAGVILTVEAGVVVKGQSNTELKVLGHLQAVGTPTQPITFTSSADSGPNQWHGLVFDGGTGELHHVTVRYGGQEYNSILGGNLGSNIAVRDVLIGNVRIESSRVISEYCYDGSHRTDYGLYVSNSQVVVSDTLFSGNGNSTNDYALYATGASTVLTVTGNTFQNNDGWAARVEPSHLHQVRMIGNTFSGNGKDRVLIAGGAVAAGATLMPSGLEGYELDDDLTIPAGVTLTVEPGAVVMGQSGVELKVLGHLEAVGTPTQPITFTSSADNGPSQWQGLVFDGGTGELHHVTARYGGNEGNSILGYNTGSNIAVRDVLTGNVHIESSRVISEYCYDGSHRTDYGLYVSNSRVVLSDTLFSGNGYNTSDYALYATGASTVTVKNSAISDNAGQGIHSASTIQVDARSNWWGDASGPGGEGPGTGDEVSGNVTYYPWLPIPDLNYTIVADTYDAGDIVAWRSLSWVTGTVTATVRVGNNPDIYDVHWSDWAMFASLPADLSGLPPTRYLEWRILSTTVPAPEAVVVAHDVFTHTDAGGLISGDTTWNAANSPYLVASNILVNPGVTLTVEPGVTVWFDDSRSLQVEGMLIARGAPTQPITFTSWHVQGQKDDWGAIAFSDTAVDATFDAEGNYLGGSALQHATIEYAGAGSVQAAVQTDNAAPWVDHCTIRYNGARGMYNDHGNGMRITENTISDNSASSSGGGIYNYYGSNVIISGNTISDNSVPYGNGGGIYNNGSNTAINDNTIAGNTFSGWSYGGGICNSGSNVTISGNTISTNAVLDDGGGIYNSGSNATINGNTVSGNSADTGAGIYHSGSSTIIAYNTVVSNTVSGSAGGIYIHSDYPTIHYNSLQGNDGYALYNNNAYGGGSSRLDARHNWWGTADDATIQGLIYDFSDNNDKGVVDYAPYLTSDDPVLVVAKRVVPAVASEGTPVTYTVSITNQSPTAAGSVTLSDSVPTATTYISGTLTASRGSASLDDGTISWSEAISPGEQVDIRFAAVITTSMPPAFITNTATITGDGAGGGLFVSAMLTVPLTVVATEPTSNGLEIAQNGVISAAFNRAIDGSTVNTRTFTVRGWQTGVYDGVGELGNLSYVFTPANTFKPGEEIVVNLSRGLKGAAGLSLTPYAWGFRAAVAGGSGVFDDSGQGLGSSSSYAVALGDLDGDGDLDAFVGNYNQANKVWLNEGTGVFTDSGQSLGSSSSLAVALGDLDGDGDLDAFVGNYSSQANKVWLNEGTGVFTDSGQSLGSSSSRAVALGDVDGDGDLDAFVANYSDQANRVWLNDGAGNFNSSQSLGSSSSFAVTLGDVDGDGDLDAFVGNYNQANKVWLNEGTGVFTDSGQSLGSSQSRAVALGDLDGDGDLDAFVGNYNQANKVWLNEGSVFTDSGQSLGSSDSRAVALGDVDGDGDLDAFVGNYNQANKVWLNEGSVFTDSGQSLGGSYSYAVALGDVNGDGDLDAFVGNYSYQANEVWLNRTPPSAPTLYVISNPDSDGDYLVDWSDVTGAITYTLEEDDNPDFTSPAVRYSGGSSQYQVTGQAEGTWYYRVKASNASGDSTWSNTESVGVVPDAPTLYEISNPDGDGDYLVDWSNVTGAITYTLEEDDNLDFTSATICYSGAESQYSVTGQSAGAWHYRVCASNAWGDSTWSDVQSVIVPPPTADFTASQRSGTVPLTVQFTDLSTGDITAWLWDFDGITTTIQHPTHTYTIPGHFGVTLTVSGPSGSNTASKPDYITVNPPVPSAPTLYAISNPGGDGDYLVDWNDVTGAITYTLEEDDNPDFDSPTVHYSGAESQYSITDQPFGAWYYRVRASNAGGDSSWSDVQPVMVTQAAPAAPTLYAISNADADGDYLVDWDDVTGATSYTLEEDDNTDFNSLTVRYSGPDSQYSVTGQPAGLWHYRVQASSTEGDSTWSSTRSVTVKARVYLPLVLRHWPPIPDIPTLDAITPNPACDEGYTVSWGAADGADSYILEEATNSAFTGAAVVYSGADLSYHGSQQVVGRYYYRVKARNSWGDSDWSTAQWVDISAPAVPTLDSILNLDDNGDYTVSWSTANLATSYVLQEATKATDPVDGDFTAVYTGPDTSYPLSGKGAARYHYRVKARNSCGDSDWSNVEPVDVLWEAEPNDDALTQANGPVVSGLTYYGAFPSAADPKDYFYFDLPAAHTVELWLTDIPAGHNYDLTLRDANLVPPVAHSGEPGDADEYIKTGVLQAGRYYIHVSNASGTGSTQPYHLQVVYQ